MATFRLTLEYDGGDFHGWQRQPRLRTVEGELRAALDRIGAGEVELTAAGRTDAGAHAHGQVVGLHARPDLGAGAAAPGPGRGAPRGRHGERRCAEVADGFHARRHAVARTYRYLVVPRRAPLARRFAWEVSREVDLEAMRGAAELLRGRHDFGAFGRSPQPGGGTVRTVHDISVRRVTAPCGGESFPVLSSRSPPTPSSTG